MELGEIVCGGKDWIGLAQDTRYWMILVTTIKKLQVPKNFRNFLSSCKTGSLWSELLCPLKIDQRFGGACRLLCQDLK
jgi:hypothetical protein